LGTGDRRVAGSAVDDAVAPPAVDDVVPVDRLVGRADLVFLAVGRVHRVPVGDAGSCPRRGIPVVREQQRGVVQRAGDVDRRLLRVAGRGDELVEGGRRRAGDGGDAVQRFAG